MKNSIFILLIIFCFKVSLFAQNYFEALIPWEESGDTSAYGFSAIEDENSDFVFLANINSFYGANTSGIPTQGYPSFGSGLVWISKYGETIKKKMYNTNYDELSGPGGSDLARVPTNSFILGEDNEIILPYSAYVGILPCDTIPSTFDFSYKKRILNINFETGDTLQNQIFPNDILCDNAEIVGIKQTDFGYVLLSYDDFYENPLSIDQLNHQFELIDNNTFPNGSQWVQFSEFNEEIIIGEEDQLSIINYQGELIQTILIEVVDTLILEIIKWEENLDYYIIKIEGRINNNDLTKVSKLFLINKNTNSSQYISFYDKAIKDVEITNDNEILVLFDISDGLYDTIPLPIQIQLYDTELNLISSKDYGFPFIISNELKLTKDQEGFFVTGTRFKSIDVVNGKEANQIYFMSDQIDHLLTSFEHPFPSDKDNLKVYPNPSNDLLNIQVTSQSQIYEEIDFQIFDNLGRLLIQGSSLSTLFSIDLSSMVNGTYICKFRIGDNIYLEKLIKY